MGTRRRVGTPRRVGRGDLQDPGRRAQRARRQSAHRGQPPLLLRDHQPDVRERRVARVGAPLGRRGDAARDRDPRLHHGHARGRSRRARTRADAPGVRRTGAAARIRRRHARVRRAAGVGDAHLASQHRELARGRGRLQGDGARRGRREPALSLLSRPRVGGARGRPVRHGVRDRAPGAHVRDAGRRHSRFQRARVGDRRGRHLRPGVAPRSGARAGRVAPLGDRDARGPRRPTRNSRASASSSTSHASSESDGGSPIAVRPSRSEPIEARVRRFRAVARYAFSPASSAWRSQRPVSAAASYVLCRKANSMESGSSDVRTVRYGRTNSPSSAS